MQAGKHKRGESMVKIEPGAPFVKSEKQDEGNSSKKARNMNASDATKAHAKIPMPAIVRKEMFTAAAKASVETIRRWCGSYGNFVDEVDSSDQKLSFLRHVIMSDNLSVLQMLVEEQGLDVNHQIKNDDGSFIFAITVAAAQDGAKCLTFLQKKGARTNDIIMNGTSLVHEAVRFFAFKSLTSIANFGAHLFKKRDNFGFSPMDYISQKQGGLSVFTRGRDLTINGMKCVFLLAEHMDEKDAKTASYPFSKLFKNSTLMQKMREKYHDIFMNTFALHYSLERLMQRGDHDIAVFFIEAGVKFRSKSDLEKGYHDAIRTGAPDSLVKTLENLLLNC
tara:strand:- start:59800 stop:60804 length:1005 start_codon:yes stop_codon:yes gene_type:complete